MFIVTGALVRPLVLPLLLLPTPPALPLDCETIDWLLELDFELCFEDDDDDDDLCLELLFDDEDDDDLDDTGAMDAGSYVLLETCFW